ncbi:MAG TPA: tRNA (adenosine(37)-N6)-dimethylallyltransferase MiaA [Alphaproteobacteria bacterium]|nr:tRNA (adenosine(37)-N6)-dimethylallyltransferase MiaA [Alphaproteobacteria bacterium]HNS44795.1 tRNA (adenosine(37)-N6)-dimethylallyltransferase MiaA [Alphaproteobacteria bacterium]
MTKAIVHIIAGPTASGKSARALTLAQDLGGVVVNADSMQLYNGLALLTAQPSTDDCAVVQHRLYGVLGVHGQTNAVSWRAMALKEIREAIECDLVPVVVGGTGFYLKALMEGLSPIPEIPSEVRILAEDLLERVGMEDFFEIIREHDPDFAAKADPQNRQRLVRAFEVIQHTGRPMSYWQSLPLEGAPDDLEFNVEIISPERDVLYERCNARFDQMVAQGVVDEVAAFDELIEAGKIPPECPLTHALGFQPLQAYLRGEMDLETAIVLAKNETRHYAKRQATWFRHQM